MYIGFLNTAKYSDFFKSFNFYIIDLFYLSLTSFQNQINITKIPLLRDSFSFIYSTTLHQCISSHTIKSFTSRERPCCLTHWPVYGWRVGENPWVDFWWLEASDPGFCPQPVGCCTRVVWSALPLPVLTEDLQGGGEAHIRIAHLSTQGWNN